MSEGLKDKEMETLKEVKNNETKPATAGILYYLCIFYVYAYISKHFKIIFIKMREKMKLDSLQ